MFPQNIVAAFVIGAILPVVALNTVITVTEDPASWQRKEFHGTVGDAFSIILPETANGHSLMQVSFDTPCAALPGGFNTGVSRAMSTNFTIQLTTTDAIYIACGEPGHCHAAEASTINAPVTTGTRSLIDFTLAARATPEDNSAFTQLNQSTVGTGVSAVVVSIAEYDAPSPSKTVVPTAAPRPPSVGYKPWIIGLAVAIAAVLLAVGVTICLITRRRASREDGMALHNVGKGINSNLE